MQVCKLLVQVVGGNANCGKGIHGVLLVDLLAKMKIKYCQSFSSVRKVFVISQ